MRRRRRGGRNLRRRAESINERTDDQSLGDLQFRQLQGVERPLPTIRKRGGEEKEKGKEPSVRRSGGYALERK